MVNNNSDNFFTEEVMKDLVKGIKKEAVKNHGYIFVYPFAEQQGDEWVSAKRNGKALAKDEYQIHRNGELISFKLATKWGIRIEGNLQPIDKTFKTRESAQREAERLLKKGLGKKIVLAKK